MVVRETLRKFIYNYRIQYTIYTINHRKTLSTNKTKILLSILKSNYADYAKKLNTLHEVLRSTIILIENVINPV